MDRVVKFIYFLSLSNRTKNVDFKKALDICTKWTYCDYPEIWATQEELKTIYKVVKNNG